MILRTIILGAPDLPGAGRIGLRFYVAGTNRIIDGTLPGEAPPEDWARRFRSLAETFEKEAERT